MILVFNGSLSSNIQTGLLEFKAKYGHFRVSHKKSKDAEYYSLGHWVCNVRSSYKAMQRVKNLRPNLSEAKIKRLEDIEFEWGPNTLKKYYSMIVL